MDSVHEAPVISPSEASDSPTIVPRAEHGISRSGISENALRVLYRLRKSGYQAYLVGGGVRDLLLGREPKDFDVATDAHPEEVRQLFRNCRLVGRRFRLAHVHFHGEIIEVATFRGQHVVEEGDPEAEGDNADEVAQTERESEGRILSDNVYGTIEDDAWRRDFSVNALFYNIDDFSVVDYVGGIADLRDGVLRLIGDPAQRYREDPVRMLRAVRFAVKLGFRMHPDTEAPIGELAPLLRDIPPARLFEEVLKLFMSGYALQTYEALRHHGLFGELFPLTEGALSEEEEGFPHMFLVHALRNTDQRVAEGKPVTPAFLFAALLWEPARERAARLMANGAERHEAWFQAADEVVERQIARVSLPKRFSMPMREIWQLQDRFTRRGGQRPARFMEHPRFRAAYDFLLLRAQAGEDLQELATWWENFQATEPGQREGMAETAPAGSKRRRRRRRRKPAPE